MDGVGLWWEEFLEKASFEWKRVGVMDDDKRQKLCWLVTLRTFVIIDNNYKNNN